MLITTLMGCIFTYSSRLIDYCKREYQKSTLNKCGKLVYIGKNCIFTAKTVEIGDDVYIGANCVIQSAFGKVIIGNHVMLGPGVNIHGGNHKINELGRYMKDATTKEFGDDGTIVIEDDCWIAANSIILSNVRIGKGSVIGANSVVTKDVQPYTIYTGVPELKKRLRFTHDEIEIHEKLISIQKSKG